MNNVTLFEMFHKMSGKNVNKIYNYQKASDEYYESLSNKKEKDHNKSHLNAGAIVFDENDLQEELDL